MANPLFRHTGTLQSRKPPVAARAPPTTPLPAGANPWSVVAAAASCAPDACAEYIAVRITGSLCWTRRVDVVTLAPLGLIGSGLTSDVWLAVNQPDALIADTIASVGAVAAVPSYVAVKQLDVSMLDESRQGHHAIAELRALAWAAGIAFPPPSSVLGCAPRRMAHPCIVRLIGCDAGSGRLFIVQEVRRRLTLPYRASFYTNFMYIPSLSGSSRGHARRPRRRPYEIWGRSCQYSRLWRRG